MTIEKTNSDRIIINIDGEKGNAFFLMGQGVCKRPKFRFK